MLTSSVSVYWTLIIKAIHPATTHELCGIDTDFFSKSEAFDLHLLETIWLDKHLWRIAKNNDFTEIKLFFENLHMRKQLDTGICIFAYSKSCKIEISSASNPKFRCYTQSTSFDVIFNCEQRDSSMRFTTIELPTTQDRRRCRKHWAQIRTFKLNSKLCNWISHEPFACRSQTNNLNCNTDDYGLCAPQVRAEYRISRLIYDGSSLFNFHA